MPSVKILQHARTLMVDDGQTILEAAMAAGLDFPFGCTAGTCGACKARLTSGSVRHYEHSPYALSPAEAEAGLILACSATPQTDCEVAYLEEETPPHAARRVGGRVTGIDAVTHDVRIVRLAVEGEPLAFSAGQFARLTFPGAPARDYSMANRPDEPELEFHVRLVAGGLASAVVAQALAVGDRVEIDGPHGASHLRQAHAGPMIALAGGTGLAPVKSIVGTALHAGMTQPIRLYVGARDERDLYDTTWIAETARAFPNLVVTTVLSEPSGMTARRTGFLSDAIAADLTTLIGWKAYLAGPPAMVDAALPVLQRLGVAPRDCHADPFLTAADKASRGARG